MDVDVLAATSVFANSFAIILSGAVQAYLGMSTFFPLRRGTGLFVAYFAAKAATWAAFDVAFTLGEPPASVGALWACANAAFGVLSYLVLYRTWDSSALKVGVAGLAVDVVAGICTIAGLVWLGAIAGDGVTTRYVGYFGWRTAAVVAVSIGLFVVLRNIARPLARWFAAYRFRRERLWQIVILAVIALAAAVKIAGTADNVGAFYMLIIAAGLGFFILVAHMARRARNAQRRQLAIARYRSMMVAYDEALRLQVEYLEECQADLRALSKRINRVGERAVREDLSEYLAELQVTCDALRFGSYSESPALDVVLVSSENRFRKVGCAVEYRMSPVVGSSIQVAFIAQTLLDWAYSVVSDAESATVPGVVRFRVAHHANQLILALDFPANRDVEFPESLLFRRLPSYRGVVREGFADGRKIVRMLVEEAGSWNFA